MKFTRIRIKILGITVILILVRLSHLIIGPKLEKIITYRSKCPEEVLARLNENKTGIPPDKIVVTPWRGRHHVHGIFMLPVEDKSSKMLVVSISGAGTFCGGVHNFQNVGTSFEGIQAKPGHYLLKANFRTRTSTWLIVRGFANQLNDSRNWRLIKY